MQKDKKKEAAQERVFLHDIPPVAGMDKFIKPCQALLWQNISDYDLDCDN